MSDPLDAAPWVAAKVALAAFTTGAAARVLVSLHGGTRSWALLLIEAGVGGMLGFSVAAVALWWDPGLRDAGWGLLVCSGAAGFAGALGTRFLDMVQRALEKRLGT